MILPIYNKGDGFLRENHRGISLVSIPYKPLEGLTLYPLSSARQRSTRENQADIIPGRGCIDHMFTLWQVSEHEHMFCRHRISAFLVLKVVLDSVNHVILPLDNKLGKPASFFNLSMRTAEAGMVFRTIFQLSLIPKEDIVRVAQFHCQFSASFLG